MHGALDRRGFLEAAQKYAVAGMTAGMLLTALSPNFALAQQVTPHDKRLKTERVEYSSPQGNGTVSGYLVRPASQKLRRRHASHVCRYQNFDLPGRGRARDGLVICNDDPKFWQ